MTRVQIEAAVTGTMIALASVGLGLGPLAWRVVELEWLSIEAALGFSVVFAVAAIALAIMESGALALLATLVSVALIVLGATSVLIGLICGALAALGRIGLDSHVRAREEEERASLSGADMIDASLRFGEAAERAGRASQKLYWLGAQRSAEALVSAHRGDTIAAWENQSASGVIDAAAWEVEELRQRMLLERDLLGAEGVRREVSAELQRAGRKEGAA